MIYELRVYIPVEGRAPEMRDRFLNGAVPLFKAHGIDLVGLFSPIEKDGRIVYLTRYANDEARKKAWAAFGDDPAWRATKTRTEVNGPLMREMVVTVLEPDLAGLLLA